MRRGIDPLLLHSDVDAERRLKSWAGADADLRQVMFAITELLASTSLADLLSRYELACLLKQVRDDLLFQHERRFGRRAFQRLGQFLGMSRPGAEELIRVADVFTREEAAALAQARTRDGNALASFHMVALARVLDRQTRQELLRQTLDECWRPLDLDKHVAEANRRAGGEGDRVGRSLAVPASLDELIRQQEKAADEFLSRSARVWTRPASSLRSRAQDLPPGSQTAECAARLTAHAEKLRRLAEEALLHAAEAEHVSEQFRSGLTTDGAAKDDEAGE
jgi:hypothetical protein